jgi:hypothetical protein
MNGIAVTRPGTGALRRLVPRSDEGAQVDDSTVAR